MTIRRPRVEKASQSVSLQQVLSNQCHHHTLLSISVTVTHFFRSVSLSHNPSDESRYNTLNAFAIPRSPPPINEIPRTPHRLLPLPLPQNLNLPLVQIQQTRCGPIPIQQPDHPCRLSHLRQSSADSLHRLVVCVPRREAIRVGRSEVSAQRQFCAAVEVECAWFDVGLASTSWSGSTSSSVKEGRWKGRSTYGSSSDRPW